MSTRASIFCHHDEETGVTIHIFDEVAIGAKDDIRLEIEHPHGVLNVPCPIRELREVMRQISHFEPA